MNMMPFEEGPEEGEYPFDASNYNDFFGEGANFDSFDEAGAMYDALSDYFHDQGFSNEEWAEMISEMSEDSYAYYDEEGNLHYEFDIDWWYDEGGYGGHAHGSS